MTLTKRQAQVLLMALRVAQEFIYLVPGLGTKDALAATKREIDELIDIVSKETKP